MVRYADVSGPGRTRRRRSPLPRTPADVRLHREEVKRFYNIAERLGVKPQQLGIAVGKVLAPFGPEMQPVVDRFVEAYRREFGTDVPDDYAELALRFQEWTVARNFDYYKDAWVEQVAGPHTVAVGLTLPQLQSRAFSEVLRMVAEAYGDRFSAMALQTALIEDDAQREATWRILEEIAKKPMPGSHALYTTTFRGGYVRPTTATPDELVAKVLTDPQAFYRMTASEKKLVIEAARQAVGQRDEGGELETFAEELRQVTRSYMVEDGWKLFLDDDEVARLDAFLTRVGQKRRPDGSWEDTSGWTGDIDVRDLGGEEFGIELVRIPGGVPVYTFNEEWVRENFAEFNAVRQFLLDRNPSAQFKFGEEGVVGRVFHLWDKGVDWVSTAVVAPVVALDTLKDLLEGSVGDRRERAARQAADLREALASGAVPEHLRQSTIATIFELEDLANTSLSLGDLVESVNKSVHPVTPGRGFGEALADALEIYPGDREYALATGALSLFAQLVFDPTVILGKFVKGARLVSAVPKGTRVFRGRLGVSQAIFDLFAKTPEELVMSRRGLRIVSAFEEAAKQFESVDDLKVALFKSGIAGDMEVARRLADAAWAGDGTLHRTIVQTMIGKGAKEGTEKFLMKRMADAEGLVRRYEVELPRQIKNLEAKLRRRKGQLAREVDVDVQVTDVDGDVMTIRGWHGTVRPELPLKVSTTGPSVGFHFGTLRAALDRVHGILSTPVPTKRAFRVVDAETDEVLGTYDDMESTLVAYRTFKADGRPVTIHSDLVKSVGGGPVKGYALYHKGTRRIVSWAEDRASAEAAMRSWRGDPDAVEVREAGLSFVPVEYRGRFFGSPDRPLSDHDQYILGLTYEELSVKTRGAMALSESSADVAEVVRAVAEDGWRGTLLDYLRSKGYDGVIYRNAIEDPGSLSVLLFDTTKLRALDDEARMIADEVAQLRRLRKELKADVDDARGQLAYLRDVFRGADWEPVSAWRRLPSVRSVRALSAKKSRFFQFWDAALRAESSNEAANRFMGLFRRLGRGTGTGKRLYFLRQLVPEGAPADEAIAESYRHLADFATFVGTPESVIDEALKAVSTAAETGSIPKTYRAFVRSYEAIIQNATRLPQEARQELIDMWPELVAERTRELYRVGRGKSARSEETLWVPLVDEKTGNWDMSGVPMVEADMFHGFPLPSYEDLRDYVSVFKRYARSWNEVGGLKGRVGGAYLSLAAAWRTFNAVWARTVLHGKMLTSLPLRIQMEQALRIEALEHSSILLHPVEWFKAVLGRDDFGRFAEFPADALGLIVRDYLDDTSRRLARRGTQVVNLATDTEATIRAIVGRIRAYVASPSSKIFSDPRLSVKKKLQMLQADETLWAQFQPVWDEVIEAHKAVGGPFTSYEKIVRRISSAFERVVGTGPGADTVRSLIRTGRIPIKGRDVSIARQERTVQETKRATEDAAEIVDELKRMYEAGEWLPDIHEFPRFWGDYLPSSYDTRLGWLRALSDRLFESWYSRPDLFFGRRPLARQIAAKEYERLRSLGMSKAGATEAARTYAARQTADMLFTIGATTAADHWLRSVMPFFPAWKELATTWLFKVPARRGGGGVLGWATAVPVLVHRPEAVAEFLLDRGVVYKEGDSYRVRVGFLKPFVEKFIGMSVDTVSAPVESFVGLLPVPSFKEDEPAWTGLVPKVGAPTGLVLATLNNRFGSVFEDLEKHLTLFGGDQSLGPASWDYVLEGLGVEWIPWQVGESAKTRRDRVLSSIIDAVRLEWAARADTKPKREDYPSEDQYTRALAEWTEDLVVDAEQKARRWYLLRGLASMFLPFSVSYETVGESELRPIYDLLGELDEVGAITPLIEGFRATYPELEQYLTAKTVKLVPDDPADDGKKTYEDFLDEIKYGERARLTPEEWVVWALGNQEYARYRSEKDAVFRAYGSTPQDWLLSRYEHDLALVELRREWERYLMTTEELARQMDLRDANGNPTSFAKMFETYKQEASARYGESSKYSRSFEQEVFIDLLEGLDFAAQHFTKMGMLDTDFSKVVSRINELADYEKTPAKDPVFRAVSWYWDNYGLEYIEGKAKIWDRINATDKPFRGPLYQELRRYENEWARRRIVHPKYGVMPSPQEVVFSRLSPEAQRVSLLDWARLPVMFLSSWQRQKVYGPEVPAKTKKIEQLVDIVYHNQLEADRILNDPRSYVHPASNEYEAITARLEEANREAAKRLGLAKEYAEWNLPTYERIDKSGLINNPWWDAVVSYVKSGRAWLERQGLSPRTTSTVGIQFQIDVVNMVERYRREDREFDKIMTRLELAYGDGVDRPALGVETYWQLFFDGNPAFIPSYLTYTP